MTFPTRKKTLSTPPAGFRPEFGNEAHIAAYVILGPIPVEGAPGYGARLLRLPSKRQIRRMLRSVTSAEWEQEAA